MVRRNGPSRNTTVMVRTPTERMLGAPRSRSAHARGGPWSRRSRTRSSNAGCSSTGSRASAATRARTSICSRSRVDAATSVRAVTPSGWRSGRSGWRPRSSRPCRTARWCSPSPSGSAPTVCTAAGMLIAHDVLDAMQAAGVPITYDRTAKAVTYRSDKADGPTAGTVTADPLEFLARALVHIPDKGQVTTRDYGWYANRPRGMRRQGAPAAADGPPAIVPASRLAPTEASRRWAKALRRPSSSRSSTSIPSRARPATASGGLVVVAARQPNAGFCCERTAQSVAWRGWLVRSSTASTVRPAPRRRYVETAPRATER